MARFAEKPGVRTESEAASSGPFTAAQVRMFEAFGFLHCRAAFTATEMTDIVRAVETGRAHGLDRADGRELIVGNERLTALLLEDDRSGGAVAQLMKAMGESRWLLSGSNTLWGAAKDSGAPKGLEDAHVPEHGWHSDNPGVCECWPRIKVMMYLRDTTQQGALRLIPGSHRPEYQEHLKPLMGWHGTADSPRTYTSEYAEHTFGVKGVDIPSVAVEATVGDIVFFHHSMYHAVFNHAPNRRLLAYWFVGYPDSDARLASLWRNDVTFTAGWRRNGEVWRRNGEVWRGNGEVWRGKPSPLLKHSNPTVRALAEPPEVWERWRAKAEAAHRALPFPDAEISVYQPAAEHRLRTGMKPWRAVAGR